MKNSGVRLDEETPWRSIDGRGPLPCQHEKPGIWIRLDLIRDYAARGYCCIHGHIPADDE